MRIHKIQNYNLNLQLIFTCHVTLPCQERSLDGSRVWIFPTPSETSEGKFPCLPRLFSNPPCSYRDLQDGFLIAEIFSRYGSLFKPKIQMHSFDHTRNQRRIRNNWEQLQLFFKKNELDTQEGFTKDIWIRIPPRRYIKKTDEEYDEDNLGNDFEQLKHFLIKIYKYLTNKKIVLPEYKGRLHDRANAHTQVYQSEAGSERGT